MKKFTLTLCLTLAVMLCLCGIASAQEGEAAAIIDFGQSERYTQQDLEAAVDVILAEFDTWEGCQMHLLSYVGDEESMDSLAYANEYEQGPFDDVVMFDSAFRSPKEAYGAWEADQEYTWSWTLARAAGSDWQLLTWGWKEDWLKSEQYSQEDLVDGVIAIHREFEKMEGTSLRYIKYAGDAFSNSELEYINSLDRGSFDACAVYYVWFMSPKDAYGAWEPDMLYSWSFYLGRTADGTWQVVTYGN